MYTVVRYTYILCTHTYISFFKSFIKYHLCKNFHLYRMCGMSQLPSVRDLVPISEYLQN